ELAQQRLLAPAGATAAPGRGLAHFLDRRRVDEIVVLAVGFHEIGIGDAQGAPVVIEGLLEAIDLVGADRGLLRGALARTTRLDGRLGGGRLGGGLRAGGLAGGGLGRRRLGGGGLGGPGLGLRGGRLRRRPLGGRAGRGLGGGRLGGGLRGGGLGRARLRGGGLGRRRLRSSRGLGGARGLGGRRPGGRRLGRLAGRRRRLGGGLGGRGLGGRLRGRLGRRLRGRRFRGGGPGRRRGGRLAGGLRGRLHRRLRGGLAGGFRHGSGLRRLPGRFRRCLGRQLLGGRLGLGALGLLLGLPASPGGSGRSQFLCRHGSTSWSHRPGPCGQAGILSPVLALGPDRRRNQGRARASMDRKTPRQNGHGRAARRNALPAVSVSGGLWFVVVRSG